jgi:hypothetical protein
MRCIQWLAIGALALATAAIAAAAFDDFKVEEGFIRIDNGKDLTGWQYYRNRGVAPEPLAGKTESSDKRFQIVDGLIVAQEKDADGKGGIKDIYTVDNFDTDFTLRLQFRAAPRADSGVYIRGKQLQVRDYPTVGPYKDLKKFNTGDWNDLEIIVKGKTAECKCNGEVLEKAFSIPAKGAIGLQAESGKFEFRRIRVQRMP